MNFPIGPLNWRGRIAACAFDGEAYGFLRAVAEAVSFPPATSTTSGWLHRQSRGKAAPGSSIRDADEITDWTRVCRRSATRFFMSDLATLTIGASLPHAVTYANCEPASSTRETMVCAKQQTGQDRPNTTNLRPAKINAKCKGKIPYIQSRSVR